MEPKEPFEPPVLGDGEVHLWWGLASSENPPGKGQDWLSDVERERSERFRTPTLRARYEFRWNFVRRLLAGYVEIAPGTLRFGLGEHKKPLLDPVQAHGLTFNLSHTRDLVLCGVSRGREVGVDVETLDRRGDFEGVARRVFTARELAELEGLDEGEWGAGFLRGWTRKEAFLKAYGTGLLREPRDLHVGLLARRDEVPWSPDDAELGEWGTLIDTRAPAQYAAAVCAQGEDWTLRICGSVESLGEIPRGPEPRLLG